MATVNFLYRSTKPTSNLILRLLFRHKDTDYVFGCNTKLLVTKDYWKKLHLIKKPKDINLINEQHTLNKELSNIESYVLNAFHNASIDAISKNWLIKIMDNYYNPKGNDVSLPNGLVDYIDYFISQKKHDVTSSSITKFNVIKHKLVRMEAFFGIKILVSEIDENFKNKFIEFCKNVHYSINTIERELGLIKTFCKHARMNGLEVSPQMDYLKIKKENVKHIYLSFEEIAEIENISIELEHLDNARDWLIISCYLGQRISDFMRFNKTMIRLEDDKHLLEFKQRKTKKLMTIPLHPKVLDILKKRNGEFPRKISDQKYNEYIKIVCFKAKIDSKTIGRKQENIAEVDMPKVVRNVEKEYEKWELVTSHIGRRSFATNFYGQIPTNFLIYVTGHSTEGMFLKYIGKSNKDIALELTKYF